jgi:hypothetical protein
MEERKPFFLSLAQTILSRHGSAPTTFTHKHNGWREKESLKQRERERERERKKKRVSEKEWKINSPEESFSV